MSNMTDALPSKHELTDSLLHNNVKRVLVGVFCGLISGAFMLGLTFLLAKPGTTKLWWIQLVASVFYGGEAFAIDASSSILMSGIALHFGVSAFCGLLMGKMTRTYSLSKLAAYGLVLGGFCWLATNMFGPDFIMPQALDAVSQWVRIGIYLPFTISLGLLLGLFSRILKI